ncbi:MAG: ATP synthase F1 subcomplex gamma subunit [Parcubacteria group bacterium Gr01-1014_33]|nr:MAG: ATP synthase F1 subcomplex gamma subunit [Parcubacteria group bacterium Gr01-1014_33]
MSSIKSIKQRIKSVKSTSQITKAMEVVSATKMRKSQEFALRARPYAVASLEMIQNLLARVPELPPLLQTREVKNSLLLVITSDKGLAGAFNANVIRKVEQWIENRHVIARVSPKAISYSLPSKKIAASRLVRTRNDQIGGFTLITVGKKAKEYFERRGIPIEKSFSGYGDYSSLEETSLVAETILKGFLEGQWDEVETVYTNFRTTLLQESVLKKILPELRI